MTDGVWHQNESVPEISDGPYTIKFQRVKDGLVNLLADWTHFGFFPGGPLFINSEPVCTVELPRGGFFRMPGKARVYGREGFIVSLKGQSHGFFQAGGPFGDQDRKRYPPGGEQNCLIWPAGPGLASLNYLTMTPKMGWQESHTHPSLRLNIVLSGEAECESARKGKFSIGKGDVILLKAHERHAFGGATKDMTFVAFHPDSSSTVFDHSPMPAATFGIDRDRPIGPPKNLL